MDENEQDKEGAPAEAPKAVGSQVINLADALKKSLMPQAKVPGEDAVTPTDPPDEGTDAATAEEGSQVLKEGVERPEAAELEQLVAPYPAVIVGLTAPGEDAVEPDAPEDSAIAPAPKDEAPPADDLVEFEHEGSYIAIAAEAQKRGLTVRNIKPSTKKKGAWTVKARKTRGR